jgi:hypothetical protein
VEARARISPSPRTGRLLDNGPPRWCSTCMARVRGRVACSLVSLIVALAPAGSLARGAPTDRSPFTLDPVDASFDPRAFATEYAVYVNVPPGYKNRLTDSWTLTLELIDRAGAPDPALPGTGAAVDLGCRNAGVGISKPWTTALIRDSTDRKTGAQVFTTSDEFRWHHGDKDGCNHQDMGPHGHQGLITVSVSDGSWTCTETYKGTNSSNKDQRVDVQNGTASEATCKKNR